MKEGKMLQFFIFFFLGSTETYYPILKPNVNDRVTESRLNPNKQKRKQLISGTK